MNRSELMRRLSSPEALASRQARRKRMISVLPSLLTIGNAVCGFACITYAAKVGPEAADSLAVDHSLALIQDLRFAAMLIFGAMICDALDGPLARLAKQTSEFGAQLDSLADAISFGVAPAFLMLKFPQVFPARLLWVIAVLYMLCAVLRLARFNANLNDTQWKGSFCGLPSPAAAGVVASLVIIGPGLMKWNRPDGDLLLVITSYVLPIATFLAACLMVSRIRYPKLSEMLRGKRSYRTLVNIIFVLVATFAIHELALPLIFLYFAAGSPLRAFWTTVILRQPAVEVPRPPATTQPRN